MLTDKQIFAARRFFRNNPKQLTCYVTKNGDAIAARKKGQLEKLQVEFLLVNKTDINFEQ